MIIIVYFFIKNNTAAGTVTIKRLQNKANKETATAEEAEIFKSAKK